MSRTVTGQRGASGGGGELHRYRPARVVFTAGPSSCLPKVKNASTITVAGCQWQVAFHPKCERGQTNSNRRTPRHRNEGALRFDKERRAILLVGGDKSGDWAGLYARNILIADDLFDEH